MSLLNYIEQLQAEIDNPKIEKQPKKRRNPSGHVSKGVEKYIEQLRAEIDNPKAKQPHNQYAGLPNKDKAPRNVGKYVSKGVQELFESLNA